MFVTTKNPIYCEHRFILIALFDIPPEKDLTIFYQIGQFFIESSSLYTFKTNQLQIYLFFYSDTCNDIHIHVGRKTNRDFERTSKKTF